MICTTLKNFEVKDDSPLYEIRIDLLPEINLDQIKNFKERLGRPLIFTLRKASQGGSFTGTEFERLSLIQKLTDLNPDYFDIEVDTDLSFIKGLQAVHPKIKWIISHHDFERTPENFDQELAPLTIFPATFYKLAFMATSTPDTLKMMLWLKQTQRQDIIAISMGEFGVPGRLLAPYLGSALSYACQENESTASGQMTSTEMKRYLAFTRPQFYGLIGDPIGQSKGHIFHNERITTGDLNAVYIKIPLKKEELREAFPLLTELGFQGLSVTMPLKEAILDEVEAVTKETAEIGASNTLTNRIGKWEASNTDGLGAVAAIKKHLGSLENKKVLLIGAGGSAKAILHVLRQQKAVVSVTNRTYEKGKLLAAKYGCTFYKLEESLLKNYDLVINTTPEEYPLNLEGINSSTTAMDIKVYPRETAMLLKAKEKGCNVIYGEEMFVEQAALQLQTWFK